MLVLNSKTNRDNFEYILLLLEQEFCLWGNNEIREKAAVHAVSSLKTVLWKI